MENKLIFSTVTDALYVSIKRHFPPPINPIPHSVWAFIYSCRIFMCWHVRFTFHWTDRAAGCNWKCHEIIGNWIRSPLNPFMRCIQGGTGRIWYLSQQPKVKMKEENFSFYWTFILPRYLIATKGGHYQYKLHCGVKVRPHLVYLHCEK